MFKILLAFFAFAIFLPVAIYAEVPDIVYKDHSYSIKSGYYDALNEIESTIKQSEKALSGLSFENADAKKAIDTAWSIRGLAWSNHGEIKEKLRQTELYLENEQYKKSYDTLLSIDKSLYYAKDDLYAIVKELKDSRDIEKQYQEEQQTCFIFWCSDIKNTYSDVSPKISDVELNLNRLENKLSHIQDKKNTITQTIYKYEIEQKEHEIEQLKRQQELELREQQHQASLERLRLEEQKQQELQEQQYRAEQEHIRLEEQKQRELEYERDIAEQQIKSEKLARLNQKAETNPLIKGLISGQIRFYVEAFPQDMPISVKSDLSEFFDRMDGWYLNGIKFVRTYNENNNDLQIDWVRDFGGDKHGISIFKKFNQIQYGDTTCYGQWQPFSSASVKDIIWHELGHAMGYSHSSDKHNVMHVPRTKFFVEEYTTSNILTDGQFRWIKLCHTDVKYQVESKNNESFRAIIVTPSTDPSDFIIEGKGRYYPTCGTDYEEKEQQYFKFYSKKCSVDRYSSLIVYNPGDNGNKVTYELKIEDVSIKQGYFYHWKQEDFQYSDYELQEVWDLYDRGNWKKDNQLFR